MLALWLVIVVVAGIAEITTTGLFMATISFAAVLTAIVSLRVNDFPTQLGVFAGLALAGLILIRPLVIRLLGISYVTDQGKALTDHVVNRHAIVSKQVDQFGGQVRIGQAEFWSARSGDPGAVFPTGTPVEIAWVEGVNAIVLPATSEVPSTSEPGPTIEIAGNKGA